MNLDSILKKCSIFSFLPERDLDKVKKIVHEKVYKKNEHIFHEGEKARGFYILKSGKVKVYKTSMDGKEQILHIISEGESFGDAAVFHGETYPANAQAMTDSHLIFIEKMDFIRLIKEFPDISLKIMASLSAMLRDFTRLVEDLSLKEVSSRIAKYFLEQSKNHGKKTLEGPRFTLDLSKTQLASRLGTIPETLSRSLSKLKERDIIRVDKNDIVVLEEDALQKIAEGLKKD
ncbi:MAG TPA: Crp/Fnr family transcriptional regulator [Nitrospinota bacterium]|nr:Crp/Fnr family transcriptional regulator [Nitrospinota bacterium]